MTILKNNISKLLMSIGLMLSLTSECYALQISQEKFKDVYKYEEQKIELVILGVALKRFSVLKEVAVGFYSVKETTEEQILTNVPKRIEVASIQKISKEEFTKETLKGMAENLEPDTYKALQEKIQQLTNWYIDLEPGDRYAFTYLPGIGTQIDLNGVKQGIIEGEDFAYGLFSIYIGAKPSDIRAKQKLIGRLNMYQ